MTLHVEPPPPAAPHPDEQGMPRLVVRLDKPPRVSWWFWLFHPWQAWWITVLIREAFRWRDVSNSQPNALTWGERVLFERARQARQKATVAVASKIERLADQYQALRAKAVRERTLATLERDRRFTPDTEVQVYAAGPLSVSEAKDIVTRCQQRIADDTESGQTRHQERPSRMRGWVSLTPLLVDIVALMTVIAKFFNVTPDNALSKLPETVTTVGFALIASLVLALLAHSAGQAARNMRAVSGRTAEPPPDGDDVPVEPAGEFPPARAVLYTKLVGLFVVSAMVAVSVATRIIQPTPNVSTGPLGVMIGILVGLAAFLAPWLIVMNLMRAGSLETRTIDALTAMISDVEATVNGHEKAAIQADQRAEQTRQSAERAYTAEFEAAMNATAAVRKIVELARSYHTEAGRYALADNAPVDEPYVSMQSAIAIDTSAIDRAKRRFDKPDDPTPS